MDSSQIYREETFTDRRVGTIRRLTPVTADGAADAARPVVYVGQAQIMTPMGALPDQLRSRGVHVERRHRQVRRRRGAGRAADHARAAGAAPRAGFLAGHSRRRRRRDAESERSARAAAGRDARRLVRAIPMRPSARRPPRARRRPHCKRAAAVRASSGRLPEQSRIAQGGLQRRLLRLEPLDGRRQGLELALLVEG